MTTTRIAALVALCAAAAFYLGMRYQRAQWPTVAAELDACVARVESSITAPTAPVRQFGQNADGTWDCPPGCLCGHKDGKDTVLRCPASMSPEEESLEALTKEVDLLAKEAKRNAELVDQLAKLLAQPKAKP